jgi:hypothetical protein
MVHYCTKADRRGETCNDLYTDQLNLPSPSSGSPTCDNPQYQCLYSAITQRMVQHDMESEAAVSREFGGVMAEDYD